MLQYGVPALVNASYFLTGHSKDEASIAKKNELPLVDLRKLFLDYDLKNNPENKDRGVLTNDGVHLNAAGNELVAEEMWRLIKSL